MKSWFDSPTVDYCEKAIAGIIARPGYGISNFAFIIVGIFLILKYRKSKLSLLFGITSVIIGICSFSYDASFTYLSQYFDWLGMFIFILFLILLNLKRVFDFSKLKLQVIAAIILIVYLVLSFITQQGTLFFGLGVGFVILSEIYLVYKQKRSFNIYWLTALGLFITGFIARNLDLYRIICDPSNIFNGRGVFHYLAAVSILLLHKYYKSLSLKFK